jgi:xanthine/uracil permease
VLWVIVTVPPSFGFWLVAGDLAGVPRSDTRLLIAASLLAMGTATLIQVVAGYRLPVFEGPASTYLAAVAVVRTSGHGGDPRAVTGGLLAAGALVLLLGLVRADRIIKRFFTPAVVSAFVVIVVVTVAPDTLQRVIGSSSSHPLGAVAAWVSAALVIGIAVAGQWFGPLRAYSLLVALLFGSLAYFAIAGFPNSAVDSRWTTPSPFPWGAPQISIAIAVPFLVAGLLASFNTVASINVMAGLLDRRAQPSQERRGIAAHGAAQCITACFGNILGHVPRLDSAGVVQLLNNPRRRALATAAVATIALAFISPLVDLIARIPVPVSAALLAFVLAVLLGQGLRQAAALDRRSRWLVFAPAILPAFIWLPVAGSLSHTLQLLVNPLLIGVALGVVLDRLVRRTADLTIAGKSAP